MDDLLSYSRIEQRSVINILVSKQCKPSETLRKISVVHEESCFSQKNGPSCLNGKFFFDEDRPGRPTGARTSVMIKTVDDIIQWDRRIKVEDIPKS